MQDDPAGALVAVRGVGKRYGRRAVLSGIDLAVRSGQIVTLIGPNGAGKTTLVRILLGLVSPDEGAVERRSGLRIGYSPQHVAIDEIMPLSVRRFLELARGASRAAVAAALAEVGAGAVIDTPLRAVSGGELRRVLLARALLREPELLVLDEPIQGVDIAGQHELFALLRAIRDRRRCGVVLVSHDLHLVMAATDVVVCLNGHVCCSGRPEAVSRHPAYLKLFGPAVAGGLAVYTHHHDHGHDGAGHVVPLDSAALGHDHDHRHG